MTSENHQHQYHSHHHHHHHFYHHNLHINQRSIFLPMLCSRSSIKDVSLPQCSRDPPESFSNDPLSPRIGCTGQVKRHNKITPRLSFSHRLTFTPKSGSTSTSTTTTPSPILKYSKLKRLFSGKSLNTNTTTTAAAAAASSCGSSRPRVVTVKSGDVQKKHRCSRNENLLVAISIENMDPPLPVIKRVHKCDEEGSKVESLWKRRLGDAAALKSLQIQQIQHPRHHLQLKSAFDG